MKIRGEMRMGKRSRALALWRSPTGVAEEVGTTWYNLKSEVVPVEGAERPQFTNVRYGWYNLLQCLAHTREESGFSGILRECEGSRPKVVLSVPEMGSLLAGGDLRRYNLHFEVVPGRTKGGLAWV